VRPEIPRDLEAVILRAMSRVPHDRFARVRDLGLALMPFMSAQGASSGATTSPRPRLRCPSRLLLLGPRLTVRRLPL